MKHTEFLKEIKNKGEKELNKDLADLKNKLWDLKSQFLAGKVKNVRGINLIKKNIARAFSILNSKSKVKV